MKRPLVFICMFFIFGILIVNCVNLPFLILFILLILSLITSIIFLRNSFLFPFFLALTSIFLGACLLTNANTLSKDHIERLTPYKGKQVTLKGVIIDEPTQKKHKVTFILQAVELHDDNAGQKVTGKVLVWCFKKEDFKYGQEVILEGKLYRPYPLRLSKRFNYREYLKRKGVYSMLSVSKKGKVIFTGNNHGNPVKKMAFLLKGKVKQMITSHLSPEAAGILSAVILGFRGEVPQFVNKALQQTGTVHILAVSGLHVGIIAIVILALLKIFISGYRLRYALLIVILIFYCLLTGLRISVVRATIMAVVFLLSVLVNRDYDPFSALSFAAGIILCFNPNQLFDLGFQLSFISVFFILMFTGKLINLFPAQMLKSRPFRFLITCFSVSLVAQLATAGIVAYYFNLFTPIAVFANMIIIPVLFLIVVSGFLFTVLGVLHPALAGVLAINCEFFISLMYKINRFLLNIPGAYVELSKVELAGVLLYYLIVFVVLNFNFISENITKLKHKLYRQAQLSTQ